jgi:Cu(I)/Ag(I) efflux system membrane protein CusA/SilA
VGVDANIVALSGIAIAIGVMVDIGVVFVESVIRHMEMPENKGINKGKPFVNLIHKAIGEVSGAVLTGMLTTVISFIPVFAMEAQEGKMFHPLAFTKTFALASAFILGVVVLPTLTYFLFSIRSNSALLRKGLNYLLITAGVVLLIIYGSVPALGLTAVGFNNLLAYRWKNPKISTYINIGITLLITLYYLSEGWLPMGPEKGITPNILFLAASVAVII